MTEKIRVGVIFGGRSGEHEVSLRSAASVMKAIDHDKYEVLPVGITKEGRWLAGGDPMAALSGGEMSSSPAMLIGEPGENVIRAIQPAGDNNLTLRDIASVDVIFPVMHGTYGEDGTLQGFLELADIPYVGAGVVGSAVGMDKMIFKSVLQAHGIPVVPAILLLRSEWERDPESVMNRVEAAFSYPVFAKPANLGSSVGISKARNRAQLREAISEAAQYDRRVMVEKGVNIREIEVSVLGNDDPIASIPGEVIPGDEFYSYEDKYLHDDAQLVIPADLTAEQTALVREYAVSAYKAIDCAGLARCDFFVEKETGEIWVNEINTIPGFTSISMYPKLWEATGIGYTELIDRLIQLALQRHGERSRNKTSFEPGA